MPIHLKRLKKELSKILENPIERVTIFPKEDNILIWEGFIEGPIDSPYSGGKFPLVMKFDKSYPVKPPSVKFTKHVFHPNIYTDGKICIDILQQNWSPSLNIQSILMSLISLFDDPNVKSPANRNAAILYSDDRSKFNEKVKECISKIN
tara:strand:- start:163 stop:609 length:447 start_codon:yes stop_codon:yes gene_type:complete